MLYKSEYTSEKYRELVKLANESGKIIKDEGTYFTMAEKPQLSLEELKIEKIQQINSIYEEKAAEVKALTPESEILTWDIQKSEAEAYVNDALAATPFIDGLALARQVDRIELIDKVLSKVTTFNAYMASLTGKRQYFEDKIKSAVNVDEVAAIVWE